METNNPTETTEVSLEKFAQILTYCQSAGYELVLTPDVEGNHKHPKLVLSFAAVPKTLFAVEA